MKNIHIYALPIAVGLLGLLASPLSDLTGVVYGLIFVSVVLGIIGIRSIVQSNTAQAHHSQETLHQQLETLVVSNHQLIEEEKTLRTEMKSSFENLTYSIGEKVHQELQTLVVSNHELAEEAKIFHDTMNVSLSRLHELLADTQETIKKGQTQFSSQLLEFEEKIEDGQVIVKNLGQLVIEKITDALQESTDELIEGFDTLEETITKQQDDLGDTLREGFNEIDNQLEESRQTVGDIAEDMQKNIAAGMDHSTQVIRERTDVFLSKTAQLDDLMKEQLAQILNLFQEVERISKIIKEQNSHHNQVVATQIGQLAEISPALVEGISQLTDSKSPERKHLLKIQKNLIKKFTEQPS